MSHPVHIRPNEAKAVERDASLGSIDQAMRHPGFTPASAGSLPESGAALEPWDEHAGEALGAGTAVEPLRDVLGGLAEILRAERHPAGRQQDHLAIEDHGVVLDRAELEGLPGVVLNTFDVDGPVWLAVEAIAASEPPAINADLDIWVEPSSDPERRPSPRESIQVTVDEIEKNRLTFARHARPEDFSPAATLGAWTGKLRLEQRPDLMQRIQRYVSGAWTAWADAERLRRRTMAIHHCLSDMAAAARADQATEIMWGIALSPVRHGGRDVELPLIERPVEIEIIERPDAEIRVRPRFAGATVNMRALDATAPDAAFALRDKPDRLIEALEQRGELSPFAPIDLEQIISAAAVQPMRGFDGTDAGSAGIAATRWVLSARRRADSLALRDIERLKTAIEHAPQAACCLSTAVSALVTRPEERGVGHARRHLSSIVGGPIDIAAEPIPAAVEHGDLFFPLPAAAADAEIVRELSRADGLVVQSGHRDDRAAAVVNVVCHHLALGARVLVVSRNETALSLLYDKLPSAIRELTVSSTGSDKDVLRKAEALASRLQSLVDPAAPRDQVAQIGRIERDIISKRSQIASLDDEIAEIIRRNLRLSGRVPELPLALFDGLAGAHDSHAWFTDRPKRLLDGADPVVAAVDKAREARLRLGERLQHIDDALPEAAALPDAATILRLHAELREQAGRASEAGRDEDLALDAIATFGLDATGRLASDLDALVAGHEAIADDAWLAALSPLAAGKNDGSSHADKVVAWARDASFQLSRNAEFAKRPVQAPVEAFTKRDAIRVVERLAAGEKPFARFSPSRRGLKAAVDAITVDGSAPATLADWQYVGRFLLWRHELHALRGRWTALAAKIDAPAIQLGSARAFDDIERVVKGVEAAIVTAALAVRNVSDACRKLSMPESDVGAMLAGAQRPTAFATAIRSVMKRVSGPLVELARIGELFAGAGDLAAAVQAGVLSQVGDAEAEPQELEARWTGILADIETIRAASADYQLIRTACRLVTAAGAPDLAQRLRSEPTADDAAQLASWMTAWNQAVLMQIEDPEARQLLHDLAGQRSRLEKRTLALFEQVISARMSLGIAQSANGPVRQSLKRFRDTMQKMASACAGPTSRRLRVAARKSLEGWLEEVPCHIMPAWRVAELLPARIGTFDLLVVDPASRSDLRELTAMLRARKVLVSDDGRDQVTRAGGSHDGASRSEARPPRSLPPALRPLLQPGASLRDLAEVLFSDRVIVLGPRAAGGEALPVAAPVMIEAARPVGTMRPERSRPARAAAVAPKTSAQRNATHTLEEEIATVAKYLSMARRSGVDAGPMAPRDQPRSGSAAAVSKALPDIGVLRRRPAPATAADAVAVPALPPALPERVTVVQPAGSDQAVPRPSAAVDPSPVIIDTPQPGSPAPAQDKIVPVAREPAKTIDRTIDNTVEAATPAVSAAPPEEIKIHSSLVELAFKAAETPTVPRRRLPSRRVMAVAAAGLLVIVGAAASWERASQWLQVPLSDATAASALPGEPAPRKVNAERIMPDGKPAVAAAADEHATVGMNVPVSTPAQAYLYHEDPQDPKGKRFPGKVTWSLEQGKGPRADASASIKGEVEIENGAKVTISLRKNAELELPASHVMELAFNWADASVTGLSSMRGIGLKGEEAERGTALATQTAKVTPKYFMVALSANEVDTKRNLMLLKGKQWFDIPIVYEGGSRALLSIQKGSDGDRVFKDAFASWGQ
ncbi:ATPase AAA [Bradyrhizobium sp. STM 3809]|uniref:ATPase AAA n=1 Tax=Bradyrhizobium sp. STM 3809 TaxID=551936 RepID=UPI0002407D6F|nr:ATPase AAA [Bradyrhizobium sp. STM 3809]CCE02907.1 conserved hypothetical protein [Bradyrhizobium sp. STM 3809]